MESKKHNLCEECYKDRKELGLDVNPTIWCFHEYIRASVEAKNAKIKVKEMTKQRTAKILKMEEDKK